MARIERQPDRLAAGLDSRGISQAVHAVRELDTTSRVYVKDWIIRKRGTEDEVTAWYLKEFEGRVTPEDWKVEPSDNGRDHVLYLRLWNVYSEWKTSELAYNSALEAKATRNLEDDAIKVVVRNSRDEVELQDYGIKKLAAPRA